MLQNNPFFHTILKRRKNSFPLLFLPNTHTHKPQMAMCVNLMSTETELWSDWKILQEAATDKRGKEMAEERKNLVETYILQSSHVDILSDHGRLEELWSTHESLHAPPSPQPPTPHTAPLGRQKSLCSSVCVSVCVNEFEYLDQESPLGRVMLANGVTDKVFLSRRVPTLRTGR